MLNSSRWDFKLVKSAVRTSFMNWPVLSMCCIIGGSVCALQGDVTSNVDALQEQAEVRAVPIIKNPIELFSQRP